MKANVQNVQKEIKNHKPNLCKTQNELQKQKSTSEKVRMEKMGHARLTGGQQMNRP